MILLLARLLLNIRQGVDVDNSITGIHDESNDLPGECLDKNLQASMKTLNKIGRWFLLEGCNDSAILKLLSGEMRRCWSRGNAFIVLKLSLDVVKSFVGHQVKKLTIFPASVLKKICMPSWKHNTVCTVDSGCGYHWNVTANDGFIVQLLLLL